MSKDSALSKPVNPEKFCDVLDRVNGLSIEVESMTSGIVDEVCKDLDEYMHTIDEILCNSANPVTDEQLDNFTLNLPCLLYMTSSYQENLGIKEDVSRAVYDEVYNRVREKADGTVADKNMAAELQSQAEAISNIVYARAYKKVKLRVEAAYEMLNSVKKVMTRRISSSAIEAADRGNQ